MPTQRKAKKVYQIGKPKSREMVEVVEVMLQCLNVSINY